MQEIHDILNYRGPANGLSVALGRFDGVHAGHRMLISDAVNVARERDFFPACFSFREESYLSLIRNNCLTTDSEKVRFLESLGIEILLHPAFEPPLIECTSESFVVDLLINQWNARHIVVGYDFHFGKGRTGDSSMLRNLASSHGVSVQIVEPVKIDSEIVKSTAIRSYIRAGNLPHANLLLGQPYSIISCQVAGQRLGTKLGFPTLNFNWPEKKVMPPFGVFAVRAKSEIFEDDLISDGVASFGLTPTVVTDRPEPVLEVHLINPDDLSRTLAEPDISRRLIKIEFCVFLRSERKFENLDALKTQIALDRSNAIEILKK
jgi:riboflavin kinase / FMN adenylyltransferase